MENTIRNRLAQQTQQTQPSPMHRHGQLQQPPAGAGGAPPVLELAALLDHDGAPLLVVSARGDIGSITLGRSEAANIRLTQSAVSQIHARLGWDPERGGHVLADCSSTNGTFVNRQRITRPTLLLNGSQVRLGSVT
ncbi:MAG: FHA domain-containing protein, partial [Chloroflexota bacterium]|nr:FHA domain-containing protein [Chloroflexota bacterium]